MTKKWAFNARKPSRAGIFFKRFLVRPLHVLLIVAGFFILLSASQIHAYTPPSPSGMVSLSALELFLQPGSELPIVVRVDTPYGKTSTVSFSTDYPSSVLSVDGELSSISTSFPLERDARISAKWDAPQGDYLVTLRTHITIDNQTHVDEQFIRVRVGEKGQVTYFTSPNTTLSPHISSIVFSAENILVSRNENASVSVSFVNNGSATDYLVRLAEPAMGISVHVTNATHRFVQPGDRVVSFIEIATTPNSPFGTIPLRVEAYNLVSGEKTFLGTVVVSVQKRVNVDVSIPFHTFNVEEDDSFYSSLTLENTEYADADIIIESSSSLVQIPTRHVHVPAKSSVSVPFLVYASSVDRVRSETLYVLNSELTESVSFTVNTVPAGTLTPIPDGNVSDSNSTGTPISGLFVSAVSSWSGLIVLAILALFIFSAKFRDGVVSRLPKPVPPPKAPPAPKPSSVTMPLISSEPAPTSKKE